MEPEQETLLNDKDAEFDQINKLYDECLSYLKHIKEYNDNVEKVVFDNNGELADSYEREDPGYETIKPQDTKEREGTESKKTPKIGFKVVNELKSNEQSNLTNQPETKSERLRRLSQQLPKIIITQSNSSLNKNGEINHIKPPPNNGGYRIANERKKSLPTKNIIRKAPPLRNRTAYGDFPKRLVSKSGMENVALISNVPFEKIRLLNDTFHTLINLRWRWIVIGTVVVHFAIWLVFAVFWYITALAHYDFEPDRPNRTCVTGGNDFVTIFLASVEAQGYFNLVEFYNDLIIYTGYIISMAARYSVWIVVEHLESTRLAIAILSKSATVAATLVACIPATTIGFGDRAIDEECPESIFLFIMQLILGTGLSGVLTCVVYAKLTRPEKLSRNGVGFSKKAVISMRDGRLCLMMRAWDLNYDHIISSEFNAHFINTYRSKEGEVIRYYARSLTLQQRQFLLWPVTLVHVIDATSPLYTYTPASIADNSYEITISLKGASASMGTFTQSQSSYMPKEIIWGYRFPPVVKYDGLKQKYVIDHKKLDTIEPVDTPLCSAREIYRSSDAKEVPPECPGTPSSFSETISAFVLARSSSFRKKNVKS